MKELVFICWGGNESLADQVHGALAKKHIEAQVGGHDYDVGDKSFYVGHQILEQMTKASHAIILAQQQDKSAPGFRPNLMLEWGYLCKSLPAECVHVFLIDITRQSLPSDLIGSWAEEVPLDHNTATKIANHFIKNKRMYRVDPFDVFMHWSKWKEFIIRQIRGEEAANPYRLSQVLLHAIRPAYYYNDFKFLSTVTKMIGADTTELEQSAELLSAALRYNTAAWDYITIIERERQVPRFEDFWTAMELLCSQQTLRTEKEDNRSVHKVDPWYKIVNTSYTGLCFRQMARCPKIKDEDVLYYKNKACENFQESVNSIESLTKHKDERNNIEYRRATELWLGFAFRNYGRALCERGELKEGLIHLERAVSTRKKVLHALNISALGADLGAMVGAQVDSNILFSQYLLETIRPMIDVIRYKLELRGQGGCLEFSDDDCRKEIEQIIPIVAADSAYHQPYLVRQKLCFELTELSKRISDKDVLRELKRLV